MACPAARGLMHAAACPAAIERRQSQKQEADVTEATRKGLLQSLLDICSIKKMRTNLALPAQAATCIDKLPTGSARKHQTQGPGNMVVLELQRVGAPPVGSLIWAHGGKAELQMSLRCAASAEIVGWACPRFLDPRFCGPPFDLEPGVEHRTGATYNQQS